MLLIWLFTGFAIGTVVLLFPVRSWVSYIRENELDEAIEKIGLIVMMLFTVVTSLVISYQLFRWQRRKSKLLVTIAAIFLPLISATAALALFMNPDVVNNGSESTAVSQRFTVGPYPTESRIRQLKAEGYTGIISLLHPAVVPFEPSLLADEEKAAKKLGVELVKAPMLPWIGDNAASLKTIEELAKSGKGKYYIHCYLGKDRVNVVKNLIAKVGGSGKVHSEMGSTHRRFEKMKQFERGDIYKLDEDIYLTPYPTDEEFLSFFLAGKVRSVANLMDGKEPRNGIWIEKERKALAEGGVVFRHYGLEDHAGTASLDKHIDSILALPKPVVIHRWHTKGSDSERFRELFSKKTGRQPINLATHVPGTD